MATSKTKDISNMMLQGERNTSIELITEKMKEKRRKKALNDSNKSWSRSFSKRKGTSASFVLKASLRSNNQSLAKALAASKHDTQHAHQTIMELQRERQYLLQQANTKRQAEKECIQRFGNIKQVLTQVTRSLVDAVTSLSQALDLCSMLPLRNSSLGIPRSSGTSDDDSFGIVHKASNGISTYCRNAEMVSKAVEGAASEVMQAAGSMATFTVNLSEPGTGTNEPVPPSAAIQSKQVSDEVTVTSQSEPPIVGGHQLKGTTDREPALEFPSIDDIDFPLMFTEESTDTLGASGSSSTRQSHLPMKRSRTATLLDHAAIQRALAEPTIHDEDSVFVDSIEQQQCCQTLSSQQRRSGTEIQELSPDTAVKDLKESVGMHDNQQAVGRLRRATFNVTPVRSAALPDQTFIVPNPQLSPGVTEQPEGGPKDRYVFVHSPINVSNYKTVDMELTSVTNSSTSTSQDDLDKSLAHKSRFNHDDQVIRPWGNIHTDKSGKSSTTKAGQIKTKTKPPTDDPKSKLKKGLGKTGKSIKESSKTCPSKQSKDIKKAKTSKKKANLMSESFKNELAVFDLSAGDSFSFPPPVMNRVKPKVTNPLARLTKDGETDRNDVGSCHHDEEKLLQKVTSVQKEVNKAISRDQNCPDIAVDEHISDKQDELNQPVTKENESGPMHQEEQLDPVHQEEELDSMHQEEQLDPMHQEEQLHPTIKEVEVEPMRQLEQLDAMLQGELHVAPMHQEKQLPPMQQEADPDAKLQEEQPATMHRVESQKAEKGGKIKRKSKKARSVVTPSIDKAKEAGRKTKLSVITAQCHAGDENIFDGTYLADHPTDKGKEQLVSSKRVADNEDDANEMNASAKPKIRPPTKEKQVKAKSVKTPITKMLTDDMGSRLNLQEDLIPGSSSDTGSKPPVNMVTFDSSEPSQRNHWSLYDGVSSSNVSVNIDSMRQKDKGPTGKRRGCLKKAIPVVNTSDPPSAVNEPPLSSSKPRNSQIGHSPPALATLKINSHSPGTKKHARGQKSSQPVKRGRKRMADAVEEVVEEAVEEMVEVTRGGQEEDGTAGTGRRSRRGPPVSYKEPSLNCKMRRDASPEKKKKTISKKVSKRTALGTVTNVM